MVATEADYLTMIRAMPPGTLVTLSNVSWDEYEDFLLQADFREEKD